jgi:hypothetical protein
MASTKTAAQAILFAKSMLKDMPLDSVESLPTAIEMADQVNKWMWMAQEWRWTLGALPQVQIEGNKEDYQITLPNDFLYAVETKIVSANAPIRPLIPVACLSSGGRLKGEPVEIQVGGVGANGFYRLNPVLASNPSTPKYLIGEYKKSAPTITQANYQTPGALVFPDEWFWVYCFGVMAFAWAWGDDQRSGSVQINNQGSYAFTGFYGQFEAGLQKMKEREKLPLRDPKTVADPQRTP